MLRGVIIEVDPEEFVVIQTPSGELQRFAMEDVEYAGAADAAPEPRRVPPPSSEAAPPAGPMPSSGPLRVRVFSDRNDLTLHRQVASGIGYTGNTRVAVTTWSSLCTMPCQLTLDPGVHSLIVENSRGKKVLVRPRLSLYEDADLMLSWVNRKPQRVRRWLIGGALVAGGLAMVLGGTVAQPCINRSSWSDTCFERDLNAPLAISGGAVAIGGVVSMMIAMFTFDYGKIEIHPYGSLAGTH